MGFWPDARRLQFASPASEEKEGWVGRNPGPDLSSRLLPWADERTHFITTEPAIFQIHFNLLTSATWQQPSHFTLCLLPPPTFTSKHHPPFLLWLSGGQKSSQRRARPTCQIGQHRQASGCCGELAWFVLV